MTRALIKILRQINKTNPDLNEVVERYYTDIDLIDFLVEPILSNTDKQGLGRIAETLNQEERNQLIELPYNLVFHQTIEIVQLDDESWSGGSRHKTRFLLATAE